MDVTSVVARHAKVGADDGLAQGRRNPVAIVQYPVQRLADTLAIFVVEVWIDRGAVAVVSTIIEDVEGGVDMTDIGKFAAD